MEGRKAGKAKMSSSCFPAFLIGLGLGFFELSQFRAFVILY